MANNLRVLPLEPTVWPELADHLGKLATRAANGEIRAIAYVVEGTDGDLDFHAFHSKDTYPQKLLGELEVLKAAMIQRIAEKRGD